MTRLSDAKPTVTGTPAALMTFSQDDFSHLMVMWVAGMNKPIGDFVEQQSTVPIRATVFPRKSLALGLKRVA